jgi:hypothetical protein
MTTLAWTAIGITVLYTLGSGLAGIALARILGEFARRASDSLDEEAWSTVAIQAALGRGDRDRPTSAA